MYLVLCYHIHIFSSQISMYNVVFMKVVESRSHLGQKHYYVLLFASSVKHELLQICTLRCDLINGKSNSTVILHNIWI